MNLLSRVTRAETGRGDWSEMVRLRNDFTMGKGVIMRDGIGQGRGLEGLMRSAYSAGYAPQLTKPRPRKNRKAAVRSRFMMLKSPRWAAVATAPCNSKSTGFVRNCAALYSLEQRRRSSPPSVGSVALIPTVLRQHLIPGRKSRATGRSAAVSCRGGQPSTISS